MDSLGKPITIDLIIEKFIPVVGALFMVVGLGYLLYTSVWHALDTTVRLGLGFFCSVVLIGGGYSASEKMKYLADVIIGAGIVLLYGTLMYGAQTTDAGAATIPEVATLVTAVLFMASTTYFAAERKSKVIFALSMLAAYLTPFVIGGEFGTSALSFNSYLMYFASVNIIGTILGRDFSVRELQPLNLAGLFFGTTTLYMVAFNTLLPSGSAGWNSPEVSVFLFGVLTLATIYSIISSAKHTIESDEVFVSFAYITPLAWLFLNMQALPSVSTFVTVALYAAVALGYYAGWWYLRDQNKRYQHMGLYTGAIIALCLAIFAYFPESDIYVGILIAYLGLVFAYLYTWDDKHVERLAAYMVLSITGGLIALDAAYFTS